MPEFPYVTGGIVHSYGAVSGSSSAAVPITASGTANMKGNATEIVSATAFDANWLLVTLSQISADADYLVDILAGSSPETVIVPDLYARSKVGGNYGSYLFPVFIPRGTRLAARCQSSTANAVIRVGLILVAGTALSGQSGVSVVSGYGSTTNSVGTLIDPGGTANTDSAWVEITSATERDHHWLVVSGLFGDGSISATRWRLSVGIGAATEEVLIANLHYSAEGGADYPLNPVAWFPIFIPRGSRLSCRLRSSVTTSGNRTASIRLYGA